MEADAQRRRLLLLLLGLTALVVSVVLLIVDYFMVPQALAWAALLRLVMCPALVIPVIALSWGASHPAVQEWAVAYYGALLATLSTLISLAGHGGLQQEHLVILNVMVVWTAMVGRFWPMVVMSAWVFGCHVYAILHLGHPTSAIALSTTMLLVANMVFMLYGAYVMERSARTYFLIDEQEQYMDAELSRANEALARTVRTDPLTGLANRRHFDEFLSHTWVRGQDRQLRTALLLIDVDHFKAFNDHRGHQAGDDCLVRVAQVLQACVRKSGDLVARWGGEEFAVVMGDTTELAAISVANRIRESVQQAAIPHGHSPVAPMVTISVGMVVGIPHAGASLSRFIQVADESLYMAKQEGRNRLTVRAMPSVASAALPASREGLAC